MFKIMKKEKYELRYFSVKIPDVGIESMNSKQLEAYYSKEKIIQLAQDNVIEISSFTLSKMSNEAIIRFSVFDNSLKDKFLNILNKDYRELLLIRSLTPLGRIRNVHWICK